MNEVEETMTYQDMLNSYCDNTLRWLDNSGASKLIKHIDSTHLTNIILKLSKEREDKVYHNCLVKHWLIILKTEQSLREENSGKHIISKEFEEIINLRSAIKIKVNTHEEFEQVFRILEDNLERVSYSITFTSNWEYISYDQEYKYWVGRSNLDPCLFELHNVNASDFINKYEK